MDRTAVLVLLGGESSEHEVSISSARNVYAAIDDDKFDVHLCYIDQQGKWWLIDEFGAHIDTEDARQLLPVLGQSKFIVEGDNTDLYIDVILPILHGRNGEDGMVQGLA
ncbi:MAG: ddl, D-alanyl-alanine synthetase D-alanine-D-alanine ligase, partial [Candidatus Saccharibacteria bacterium]|nr:ddl, D-alanyl-alanine synthetase D-alanine-D-alanine ligase [Candidatus Saccharibacteria bacterium]